LQKQKFAVFDRKKEGISIKVNAENSIKFFETQQVFVYSILAS